MQTNLTPMPGAYEEIKEASPSTELHDDVPSNQPMIHTSKSKLLKFILAAFIVTGLVAFIVVILVLFEKEIRHHMEALLMWLADHKSRGFLIFLALQFVGVPLLFPVSLVTLAGGFIFSDQFGMAQGIVLSSIFSWIAIHLGSLISFLLSRFCCSRFIQKCCIHRFRLTRALDRGFEEHGIKLVALMRLSFMVPFNIFNYVMGTTSISFSDFAIGSLALALNVTVQIMLGASVNSISEIVQGKYKGSVIFEVVFVFGMIMAFIMIVVVIRITRSQLRKLTAQEECQDLEDSRQSHNI